jgi:thymidylate synthase (FAD)
MEFVQPKVFLVGETRIVEDGLQAYLAHVGAPEWTTDATSDSERLCEVMGRLCYRSFAPGLNPNVTRVREGNGPYLGNIVNVGHGSVLEHASLNFIFADVSRVFTHELVRHRAGTAMSQ